MMAHKETVKRVAFPKRVRVNDLKRQWLTDPCWDIEDTEGFEDYHEELLQFRLETEAMWKAKRTAEIEEKAAALNCSIELAIYIERLERRITKLEAPDAN